MMDTIMVKNCYEKKKKTNATNKKRNVNNRPALITRP